MHFKAAMPVCSVHRVDIFEFSFNSESEDGHIVAVVVPITEKVDK